MPHLSRPLRWLAAAVLLCPALAAAAKPATASLDLPPRLQWNANDGYCGETSFICAGLYYGQYCSQFTARALASPGIPQSNPNSQLLLGHNDQTAAQALHLATLEWTPSSKSTSQDFLAWVQTQNLAGYPVAIGVFTNEYLFYGNTTPAAGDPDYDHIVPVLAVSPPAAPGQTHASSANITFSDNGLWDPSGPPSFLFTYPFDHFQLTRPQANSPTGPIYSLKSNGTNYGIAFTGVLDLAHDTIPVRLATSTNSELPAMKDQSNDPPAPAPIQITVTVTLPDQTQDYYLYQYGNFANVPNSQFNANHNAHPGDSVRTLIPNHTGPTFATVLSLESNQTAVFRAVRVSAP